MNPSLLSSSETDDTRDSMAQRAPESDLRGLAAWEAGANVDSLDSPSPPPNLEVIVTH